MTDTKSEKAAWPTFPRRHIALATTLGLFLVFDFSITVIPDIVNYNETIGVVLGMSFAQVVLLAAWTALGPAKLLTRTLSGFCGTILVALTLVNWWPGGWLFFVIVVGQWIAIQIPLWVFRLLFNWRLCRPGDPVVASTGRDM